MAKQVLDIRAGKGMTTSQSNEFLRNANGGERLKRWSGNYDSTREHLNFEIKKGGVICEVDKKTSVPKRIKMLLEERKIWDPNRGRDPPFFRTVANIILGGSRVYSSLHDDIAKINQKYGLELGDRISETGARHRSTEEYHAELREKLMSENEQLSLSLQNSS